MNETYSALDTNTLVLSSIDRDEKLHVITCAPCRRYLRVLLDLLSCCAPDRRDEFCDRIERLIELHRVVNT